MHCHRYCFNVFDWATTGILALPWRWGSQSVSVCLPIGRNWRGNQQVRLRQGKLSIGDDLENIVARVTKAGAGEIIVYATDRDGTWDGYDIDLCARVARATSIPVVACGGAGQMAHFRDAVLGAGCAAVAAGSMFVYQGKGRGVLISYPERERLRAELFAHLP